MWLICFDISEVKTRVRVVFVVLPPSGYLSTIGSLKGSGLGAWYLLIPDARSLIPAI